MEAFSQLALVVDDDETFLRFMTFCLAKGDFKVTPLTTGAELLDCLPKRRPDIILLDRFLPDADGFELCEKIKRQFPEVPIIMFSTAGDARDVIEGLKFGADDYLPKPFSVDMLLAKVEAVSRRYQRKPASDEGVQVLGDLRINEKTHEVFLGQELLTLTKTEFRLLQMLTERPGQVIETGEILTRVLGGSPGRVSSKNNVAFHINTLRKKLGGKRHYIETVRGFGYRFSKKTSW